jgi:hypothetical protein
MNSYKVAENDISIGMSVEETGDLSIMEEAEMNLKRRRIEGSHTYVPLDHVVAISNIVERLFSRAGWILDDRRKGMKTETLEMLLFLFVNKSKWVRSSFSRGTHQK